MQNWIGARPFVKKIIKSTEPIGGDREFPLIGPQPAVK